MKPTNCEHTESCKPNYILLAVGLMVLVLPIVIFVVDPVFIIVQYMSRISNGSQLFNLFQERMPGVYLKVYVFNVTNSEAFLAGDDHKLKLQEVGPFTYQEFRMNKDFKLDEDEGVMSYYPFTEAEFQPNESIGDPRTVNVTLPNIAMLPLVIDVEHSKDEPKTDEQTRIYRLTDWDINNFSSVIIIQYSIINTINIVRASLENTANILMSVLVKFMFIIDCFIIFGGLRFMRLRFLKGKAGGSMLNSFSIFAKSGFNLLVAQLKSKPIINLDIHSFLWGYKEPLITLGNTLIPGWISFSTLGILDRLYDPARVPRLEVVSEEKDKFNIKSMDGCPGLKSRQYDNPSKRTRCNSFIDAYEGIAFPLRLTPERPIRVYRNIFCRMIELEFVGTRALDYNPGAFVYKFRNNTFSTNSETECLCSDNDCVDGVSSISPCLYGLSIGLSKAHFLHGDPKMYERIDGMQPDEEKHGSDFVIDPTTGIVLETSFTLQVNLIVKDVSFNSASRPFSNMVVPLCYLKVVQPKTSEDVKYKLRLLYFVVPYVYYGIEIIIFLIALIMLVNATKCLLWRLFIHKEINFETSNTKSIINICSGKPLVEKRRQSLEVVKYQLDAEVF